jgi:hypothetical protein
MLKTVTFLLFVTMALASALGQTAPRYGYVFAPDQRYVVVDLVAGRVVGSGNIPQAIAINGGFVSPFGEKVLILGVSPADQNAPQPKEQLAILTQSRIGSGPRLSFARWLPSPTPTSSLIWAKVISGDLMLVSWQDDALYTNFYDATFKLLKRVENYQVTPTTCLSSDGQTIYSVVHSPTREIKAVNLRSLAVRESSYASIGNPSAFYKAPKASDGCVVALIERMERATTGPSPATIYLYDLEKNLTLNRFSVEGDGRFALILKRKLLLLDLTVLLPNKLPDGTTVGLRRASPGTLILYDTSAGKETGRISVPPNGELAGVSVDGESAYYLSPNLLTVIDLINNRVTAKVTLPFPYGTFVAASEKQVEPAAQQQSTPSSRKLACGCYACGVLLAVDFPNKSSDCYGILATDACPTELAKMPDKGLAYCNEIRKRSKDGSLAACPTLASYCGSLGK